MSSCSCSDIDDMKQRENSLRNDSDERCSNLRIVAWPSSVGKCLPIIYYTTLPQLRVVVQTNHCSHLAL